MTEIVVAALILIGGAFAAIGALGIVRMPDVLIRMHAATKTGTLATILIIVGTAFHFGSTEMTIRAVAIILFLLLTAPIAAHMIGRAAYTTGVELWRGKAAEEPQTIAEQEEAKATEI